MRGPGGVEAVPDGPGSPKDPFLDVGAAYECEGLATGLTPRSDRALALDGARGAPAAFDCTYLDERVWIGRDDSGAAVVFAREP